MKLSRRSFFALLSGGLTAAVMAVLPKQAKAKFTPLDSAYLEGPTNWYIASNGQGDPHRWANDPLNPTEQFVSIKIDRKLWDDDIFAN